MYTITINGRTIRYATIEQAKETAQRIYEQTGVIVGIEYK
jgi:hypothetical protein